MASRTLIAAPDKIVPHLKSNIINDDPSLETLFIFSRPFTGANASSTGMVTLKRISSAPNPK
ncbi:hypothetical protein FACS189494_08340 [Spirochaetia bacterium]|nr:hypothetical protein FACS189494_08340 [Spirochaetia bacterium]